MPQLYFQHTLCFKIYQKIKNLKNTYQNFFQNPGFFQPWLRCVRRTLRAACRRWWTVDRAAYRRQRVRWSASNANSRCLSSATFCTKASRTASPATRPSTPTHAPNAAYSSPPTARSGLGGVSEMTMGQRVTGQVGQQV